MNFQIKKKLTDRKQKFFYSLQSVHQIISKEKSRMKFSTSEIMNR